MSDNGTHTDATSYRTSGPEVTRQFDFSETSPSDAVVRAISVLTDTEPTTLEPLYETVDPEALDTLIRNGDASTELTIRYLEYRVVVRGDETVEVYPDYR